MLFRSEHLEILFGEGATLTVKKELSQPGQFAAEEKVKIEGPKGSLSASILGPCRKATQVEISLTDARSIGVACPVRESGDIEGSGTCKLVGPKGEVTIDCGVIAAKRHIHMTPSDAAAAGVAEKEIVSVKVACGNGRDLVLGDVVIRVSDSFATAMHIDTDEANAASCQGTVYGEIVK